MKRALIFAVVVAVALGLPMIAHSKDGTIPVDLTFTTDESDDGNGTIVGTFGGVPVTGTFTGDAGSGDWILTVDGQVFVDGTYACDGECVFTATTLMGRSTSFDITIPGRNGAFVGDLQGLFRNHGAWVSTVAKWSNTSLAPGRVGKIVSGAAKLYTSPTIQRNGARGQDNIGKVRGNAAKLQSSGTRAGKTDRVEARGRSKVTRGGTAKAGHAKERDHKGRIDDPGASQGNRAGHGNAGGQGNGNGHGSGNGNGGDGGDKGNGGDNGHGGGNDRK